jgi:hypothetical protein
MFTLFGRFHRHKDIENALLELSEEISILKYENIRQKAKFAVGERERQKKARELSATSLPQDVRDVLAQFPDADLEAVLDSEGHALYSKSLNKLDGKKEE